MSPFVSCRSCSMPPTVGSSHSHLSIIQSREAFRVVALDILSNSKVSPGHSRGWFLLVYNFNRWCVSLDEKDSALGLICSTLATIQRCRDGIRNVFRVYGRGETRAEILLERRGTSFVSRRTGRLKCCKARSRNGRTKDIV